MNLSPGEPAAGPWEPVALTGLATRIVAGGATPRRGPLIVGIDGRSASGKSTLTGLLAATLDAAVIHADDVCWNEPLFEWEDLLRDVLLRLREGGLDFVPPAWTRHGRAGSISVPAGAAAVFVEGVGATHRAVADLIDVRIWVQSDDDVAERRGLTRDITDGTNGDAAESERFWFEWIDAERRFLAVDSPWERAHWVVAGTPPEPLPAGTVACAPGPLSP